MYLDVTWSQSSWPHFLTPPPTSYNNCYSLTSQHYHRATGGHLTDPYIETWQGRKWKIDRATDGKLTEPQVETWQGSKWKLDRAKDGNLTEPLVETFMKKLIFNRQILVTQNYVDIVNKCDILTLTLNVRCPNPKTRSLIRKKSKNPTKIQICPSEWFRYKTSEPFGSHENVVNIPQPNLPVSLLTLPLSQPLTLNHHPFLTNHLIISKPKKSGKTFIKYDGTMYLFWIASGTLQL